MLEIYYFIISKTIKNVWDEWEREHKRVKIFLLFWCVLGFSSVIVYSRLCRYLFSLTMEHDIGGIVLFVIGMIAPFILSVASLVAYFIVNVLWCLIFPLAGIYWVLGEEDKRSKHIHFKGR